MLVYIAAKNQHMVLFNDNSEHIFLTLKIRIMQKDILINKEIVHLEHEKSLSFIHDHIQYFICFSMYHDNYHKYVRYILPDHYLTIGNRIDHDICLQDKNLNQPLIFNLKKMQYEYQGAIYSFSEGQIFEIINLRFTIHPDFIMINQPQNCFVNLNTFNIKDNFQTPILKVSEPFRRRFRPYDQLQKFKLSLDKPDNMPVYEPMPLALILIPSILMSSASLINGLIMTYNALLNQRKVLEIIPMLIMPLTMVFSSCLVLPLQRKFEQKRFKNKCQKRNDKFRKMLQERKLQLTNYKKLYVKIIEERFFTFMMLYNKAIKLDEILWSKTNDQDDFLKIMLGKAIYDINIDHQEIEIIKEDDVYCIYSEFIKDITKIESYFLIDLKRYKIIAIVDEKKILDFIILQLTIFHHPEDILLCIICNREFLNKHNYFRYIPHLLHRHERMLICDKLKINKIKEIETNKKIIVINCFPKIKIDFPGLCINVYEHLDDVNNFNEAIITKDKLIFKDFSFQTYKYIPASANLEKLYMKINDLYQQERKKQHEISLFDVLGINFPEDIDILANWSQNHTYDGISQAIGLDEDDHIIYLDLSAKRQGPHGIIAGSTGSGKSELIISYFMSLCLKYDPYHLQLMIIDFKGGGIIQAFANNRYKIPHLVQTMTNLNKTDIKRCLINLQNECLRRQIYFKKMADILNMPSMDIDSYQLYHDQQNELPMLAHLIIIVDEFAELKQSHHDFIYQLISIARIGRSLGIHLILSTQKPKGVIDEQIFANTHFVICLKVQNKEDSMELLSNDKAYRLKKCGEFILSYDENQIYAQSGYGMMPFDKAVNKNKVQILDEMQNIIHERAFSSIKRTSQIEYIGVKMANIPLPSKIMPLWNVPLSNISNEQITYYREKGILLGIVDDFYHNEQNYLYHWKKPLITFIPSKESQAGFLKMYLFNMMKIKDPYGLEAYIIDDGLLLDKFLEEKCWIEKIEDQEQLVNFFRFNLKTKKNKLIIFSNIHRFYNTYETQLQEFYDMLTNYELYNIQILIMAYSANALAAKIMNLVSNRISIGVNDKQELFDIFNTNEGMELDLEHTYGLYKDKNLLPFIKIDINDDEFITMVKRRNYFKQHKILKMPKHITLSKIIKGCLGIGISYLNYQPILISDFPLLVIGKDLSCLNKLLENCIKQDIKVSKDLNEHAKVYIINVAEYQRLSDSNYYLYRIWIGPGFKEQYYFNYLVKDDLALNEGILEFQGNYQRVRIYDQ